MTLFRTQLRHSNSQVSKADLIVNADKTGVEKPLDKDIAVDEAIWPREFVTAGVILVTLLLWAAIIGVFSYFT